MSTGVASQPVGSRSFFKTGMVTPLHVRLPLAATDLVCRILEDGATCLCVKPSYGKKVWLMVWSEDPRALPRARERFCRSCRS